MKYRYKLWGINWLPFIAQLACGFGMWAYLKYYDASSLIEISDLKWKLPGLVLSGLVLWRSISRGWFKLRYAYYVFWFSLVLFEIGQSVFRHDGLRFVLSLILGFIFYSIFNWVETCLGQAGVNPKLSWYIGKLSSVPLIDAEVKVGESPPFFAKVRAVDEGGVFLLFEPGQVPSFEPKNEPIILKFRHKTNEITAEGRPVASLEWEQRGLGLQFLFEDLYHQNKVTSFVQQIKGEGLV